MKKNTDHLSHLFELNLAMVFIGTSGALGRYIDLPVPVTICLRALLACILLIIYCKLRGFSFKLKSKDRLPILLSGLLLGLHWVTYFKALQMSSVAIGMLSMFTYPVITAFLEPLLLKTKFQGIHFLLALLVLCGIYFLVPDFNMENTHAIAVLIGVSSALLYALRNLILKTKVKDYNGSMLMGYQTGVVFFLMFPVLFWADGEAIIGQWKGLVTLAFLTTAIGHTLFLNSFKHFSITTASIISSLQPIYGILIGMLFLSEIPSMSTIIGGILILGSVVIESIRSGR